MIDGFYGYNQIYVLTEDIKNTSFTTPWGTFMYAKISFGLMNTRETFHQAMDNTFIGERDKFVVIYLDDIIVFSIFDKQHRQHLRRVFSKCRKFGLSLNPKKSLFAMKEGKLLWHIVSAKGVSIDSSRVEDIQTLSLPRYKKEVLYFLGKINFLRRFVSNFVELVKHIIARLMKGNEMKWNVESRYSFIQIMKELTQAPMLISLDYSKDFFIFSFAHFDTVETVLLQKIVEGLVLFLSLYLRIKSTVSRHPKVVRIRRRENVNLRRRF